MVSTCAWSNGYFYNASRKNLAHQQGSTSLLHTILFPLSGKHHPDEHISRLFGASSLDGQLYAPAGHGYTYPLNPVFPGDKLSSPDFYKDLPVCEFQQTTRSKQSNLRVTILPIKAAIEFLMWSGSLSELVMTGET